MGTDVGHRVTTGRPPAVRVRGMLLGAAVGDALGWPQEMRGGLVGGQRARDTAEPGPVFRDWTRTAGRFSARYRDPVLAGEYSDDTQLLCATTRACLSGERWWDRLTAVELPAWPAYQRGGGGAVLSAAASWAAGRPPWQGSGPSAAKAAEKRYRGAGANGAAMRIAPHAVVAGGPADLAGRVLRDGLATHGHPRALVGAAAYAAAVDRALTNTGMLDYGDLIDAAADGIPGPEAAVDALPHGWGTDEQVEAFARAWQTTCDEMTGMLGAVGDSLGRGALSSAEATLEGIGSMDPAVNGAGTVTAAGAVYLASRFAARPAAGLVAGAFLRRADTDTLASMAGALLGAVHGTDWLGPLADTVQDADYLRRLASRLTDEPEAAPPDPAAAAAQLRRALVSGPLPEEGEFPDGRRYRVTAREDLDEGRASRARLVLSDGQTAIVDRPLQRRVPPGGTRPRADEPTVGGGGGPASSSGDGPADAINSPDRPGHPPAPALYPLGGAGEPVRLHSGAMTVGGVPGTGRIWLQTAGGTDHRWEFRAERGRHTDLGDTRLGFVHSSLGPVEIPVRVTSTAGHGIVLASELGAAAALDEVVVQWMNMADVPGTGVLSTESRIWRGRWAGTGGGWSMTLDARPDLSEVSAAARSAGTSAVTHTAVLRREDRGTFTPEQAKDALAAWQTALSFAHGRWTAPVLACGMLRGRQVWETWASWRCDPYWSAESWWNRADGTELAAFARQFLDAWVDPLRHDRTRHVAHHVVEANKPAMVLEARMMLLGAALEYLSWVTHVLGGRRTARQQERRTAADNLRELLAHARIPPAVPVELHALERFRVQEGLPDAPAAVARLRNQLVHPKDAGEPYRIKHLLVQSWQLQSQYSELLLLRDLGYDGSYCRRFPPGRYAGDIRLVPWAAAAD